MLYAAAVLYPKIDYYEFYMTNEAACHSLEKIGAYLRADDIVAARCALQEVLIIPGIEHNVRDLIGYAVQLKDDDLCGTILLILLDKSPLAISEKAKIGVQFALQCFGFGARHVSVRCLRRLSQICDDNDDDVERIIDALVDIQEFSMALSISEHLAIKYPSNRIRQLDVIRIQCNLNAELARVALKNVLSDPEDTVLFWERVAICRERMLDYEDAISATRHALSLGGNEFICRRRIILLLLRKGDIHAANIEIRILLGSDALSDEEIRQIAGMASRTNDDGLTLDCALRQFRGKETETTAYLHLLHTLNNLTNVSAATTMIESVCDGTSGLQAFSAHLWYAFSNEARRNGRYDLEIRLVNLGLEKFPKDKELLTAHNRCIRERKVLGSYSRQFRIEIDERKSSSLFVLKLFSYLKTKSRDFVARPPRSGNTEGQLDADR